MVQSRKELSMYQLMMARFRIKDKKWFNLFAFLKPILLFTIYSTILLFTILLKTFNYGK